jgi:hypothetical protein
MTPTQQLHRCARALQRAERSLPIDSPYRTSALMAAREEIDATLRTLRRHPWPRVSPAVMAVAVVCWVLTGIVAGKTLLLLTEGRPAVEVRR